MPITPAQEAAVRANGNVLVAAGAGAGKTSTLVERCVDRLLDPQKPARLDDILMVTFTESAAAEMRARVRQKLESLIASGQMTAQAQEHAEEQLAMLDTANICTLHSYCLKLVRQHFHQLGADPQVVVLDEAHASVLMDETLDQVMNRYYLSSGKEQDAEMTAAVQRLMQNCGGGSEGPIRAQIRQLHEYSQTLVDPAGWLGRQSEIFLQPEPVQWREWLLEALHAWRERWSEILNANANPAATTERKRNDAPWNELHRLLASLDQHSDTRAFAAVLAALPVRDDFGRGAARPSDSFFKETSFLRSLAVVGDEDPLAQDWEWVRGDMTALLRVTREFAEAFSRSKREQGAVDFHDLEQFALRLLRDPVQNGPTGLARKLQRELRFLFIDECQDINAAQDAILRMLSSEQEPNRFLVGDVKQSIYRFRLADPRIFQEYERRWREGDGGRVISLQENFRSREALIHFFNAVFSDLMREQVGGVSFDEHARLIFGPKEQRQPLAFGGPRAHFHLLLAAANEIPGSNGSDESHDEADDELASLTADEQEARITAAALASLRRERHQVWDDGHERDVEWRDMAVLLRAPGRKAQVYAREFARQGIPVTVAQNDFFECLEVADLLNILTILDNPLQDIPLLAVLHSPIGGLSTGQLAEVRLAARRENFWTALNVFHRAGSRCATWDKVDAFLERYERWRRMGRDTALSARLHTILTETGYVEWLEAQAENEERAAQCGANVRRLLTLAEQFDPFQRQGLTRFLRFVTAQQQVVGREPVAAAGNAVQLISIHRSKGLEYPVVALPDLAKQFNFQDLTASVLIDSRYGLCPKVKSPMAHQRYPSLPHWMSSQAERPEILGEELRLLYVAMTRARDTLLLFGSTKRKTAEKWRETNGSASELLAARSMLAWLGPWIARHSPEDWLEQNGANELFTWHIHHLNETRVEQTALPTDAPEDADEELTPSPVPSATYAHAAATREAAKASVSSLRRKMLQSENEARVWFAAPRAANPRAERETSRHATAAEIGVAHHTFLEFADLRKLGAAEGVRAETARLVDEGVLTEVEGSQLDVDALADFWASQFGQQISNARDVRRELPFTARFDCAELPGLGLGAIETLQDEFIIVQGVVDLAVLLGDEIWLLDFKTDAVSGAEVEERAAHYRPQLAAYSAALERIYPGRRVSRRCLHFLSARRTVEV